MSAIDNLMRVVDEVIGASAQCSTAQRDGATWEEFMDERKHYAAKWSALKDMLQNLLSDRTRLEYEATVLMTAMTDVLSHFTKTPSTLRDSEVRGMGHAANDRMKQALQDIGSKQFVNEEESHYAQG